MSKKIYVMDKPHLEERHAEILKELSTGKLSGYRIPNDEPTLHDLIKWKYITDNGKERIYRDIEITYEGEDALKIFELPLSKKATRKIKCLDWNSIISAIIAAIVTSIVTTLITYYLL
jgi:hypothetical protein